MTPDRRTFLWASGAAAVTATAVAPPASADAARSGAGAGSTYFRARNVYMGRSDNG